MGDPVANGLTKQIQIQLKIAIQTLGVRDEGQSIAALRQSPPFVLLACGCKCRLARGRPRGAQSHIRSICQHLPVPGCPLTGEDNGAIWVDFHVAGAVKGARGATAFCRAHGGGRRCQMPNCGKGAEGATD